MCVICCEARAAAPITHVAASALAADQSPLRERILSSVADPNVALLLLVLGTLGIYAEFSSPGLILPGVLGAVLLVLGIAALALFPIDWRGAALMILGLALLVMEARFATHGILAVGGAIALPVGALLLIDTSDPVLRIHPAMALAVTIPFALITLFLLSIAVRARRNKAVTGMAALPGQSGVAIVEINPAGTVMVRGEYWSAVSATRIATSDPIKVTSVDGFTLTVEPAPAQVSHP